MFFLPTVNNAYTYTSIKVINPSVNQITLPSGFIIGSSSIVEDSYIVQLYDNVKKKERLIILMEGRLLKIVLRLKLQLNLTLLNLP